MSSEHPLDVKFEIGHVPSSACDSFPARVLVRLDHVAGGIVNADYRK